MKIHIIVAALPPQLDGIGDYTANLAWELAKSASIKLLTGKGTRPDTIPGVSIEPAFIPEQPASVREIEKIVEADRPDWVLLQYNPFSYGRWGLNLSLPQVMCRLKRSSPTTRFALMVHETYVPPANWKFAIMTTWQRRQFRALGNCADVIFFSIDPWAQQYRAWFPETPILHLPVGSNIPQLSISRKEARQRLGIAESTCVIGLFSVAHASWLMEMVRSAVEASQKTGAEILVLYIGSRSHLICNRLQGIPVCAEGPLPAEEVSRRFAAMDIYLAPYIDGISTRRTAMLTGLQHGIATIATQGYATDHSLAEQGEKAFLLADVHAPEEFTRQVLRLVSDPALRQRVGQAGQELYQAEFLWEQIASRLLEALQRS